MSTKKHREHDLFIEETVHAQNAKSSRQERKRLTQKDRSKYKKTDLEKVKPFQEMEGQWGKVLQIKPEGILCQVDHKSQLCHLKGTLKKEKNLTKTLIAVGDEVKIQEEQNTHQIIQILPRRTLLSRADNLSRKKQQIIAANVDQVLITCSILDPHLKHSLVDRYLIAAYKGGLKPVILVTKVDLIDSLEEPMKTETLHELNKLESVADALHIPLVRLSVKTKEGLETLKKLLQGTTSVFSGQSGVGKSSLINQITRADQQTAPVVSRTRKGSHTTTYAVLLPLKEGEGYCVDTPGIRSFGLWDIKEEDIRAYFKEIDEASSLCKFPDCRHQSEPGCHVKELCQLGIIKSWRFESYLDLISQIKIHHLRR